MFTKLISYPVYPDQINIQWDIDNIQVTGNYKFNVCIHNIGHNSGVLYNKYNYTYSLYPLLSQTAKDDISITVSCTPPENNYYLKPFEQTISLYHGLDPYELNIANEIVRKETMIFERKIGLRVKAYKRKKLGPLCKICIDQSTGTSINANCPYCYGTKIEGGYYPPITLWADIVEMPVEKPVTEIGTQEEKRAQIRLSNFILLSKKDLLVDEINNNRWEIAAEPTWVKYRSYPVSQQAVAFMINTKSIVYTI